MHPRVRRRAKLDSEEMPLPLLPLDKIVPSSVLQRRGGISFGSSCKPEESSPTQPRLQRRGAISLPRNDDYAVYVRCLGDLASSVEPRRRASVGSYSFSRGSERTNEFNDCDMASTLLQLDQLAFNAGDSGCPCETCTSMRRRPLSHLSWRYKNPAIPCSRYHRRPVCRRYRMSKALLISLGVEENGTGRVRALLSQVDDWSFDIFALSQATSGRSLFNLAIHLFQKHGLIEHFRLDMLKLMRFLCLVERDYRGDNPYHNETHAADVTQATHCLMSDPKINHHFSKLEVMAMLLAALTHDIGHPGVNQDFLISTSSHLARIHGPKSVLERHHCHTGRALLVDSQLLDHLPTDELPQVLSIMNETILATDMARHKEFMTRFESMVSSGTGCFTNSQDRTLICQMLMKCADISNPCRPWRQSERWSHRIMEEFYRQGDFEKEIGLKVSFDRCTTNMAKSQSGFFEFVVDPLFTLWDRFASSTLSKLLCRNLDNNKASWDDIFTKLQEECQPVCSIDEDGDDDVIEDIESEVHSDSSTD